MSQGTSSLEKQVSTKRLTAVVVVAAVALLAPAMAAAASALPYEAATSPATLTPLPLAGGTAPSVPLAYPADTSSARLTLPFSFNFYERTYSAVTVSSNGYLTFDPANSGTASTATAFPATANPKELVAVWMADTKCFANDSVKWQVIGTAPTRQAVIEWNCSWHNKQAEASLVQAWLTEGSSTVEVVYGPNYARTGGYTSGVRIGVSNFDGSSHTYGLGSHCNAACALTPAAWPANTRITYSQGPELRVTSVRIPEEGYSGVAMPVSTTIRNTGGKPAVDFTVQLWLSPTTTKGAGAIPLGGPAPFRQSVLPGQSVRFDLRPTIPLSVTSGSYHVVVEADPDHVVPLPSRGGSFGASASFRIGVPAPNLAALDVLAPAEIQPGKTFDLSWTAANVGNAPAYHAAYQVLLSASETPSASSRILSIQGHDGRLVDRGFVDIDEQIVPPAPDRLYRDVRRTERVFLPADVPAGRYFIGVRMDPDLVVYEHDRGNNTGVSKATVAKSTTTLAILTQPTLATAEAGSPYSIALQAVGGDGSYFWKVSAGSRLPPGLWLEEHPAGAREAGLPFVSTISGTPSETGDFEFSLDVMSGALTKSQRFSLTVVPQALALNIQTRDLPTAAFETPYRTHLVAGGGEPPYVWALVSGKLPGGLQFGVNGTIEGRPLQDGVFPLTVRVTDSRGVSANQSAVLVVLQPSRISCGTTNIGPLRLGEAVDATLQAGGGSAKYWELHEIWHLPVAAGERSEWYSRQAPPGLSLGTDGRVTGAPTRAGLYDWLVGVKDDPASNNPTKCLIRVEVLRDRNLTVTTSTLVDAVIGNPYAVQLEASGGEGVLHWAIAKGEKLPAGLTVTSEGLVTGTPTGDELAGAHAGNIAFTVRVVDSMNRVGNAPLSITLLASPPAPGPADDEATTTSCQSAGADPSVIAVAAVLGLALLRRRRP